MGLNAGNTACTTGLSARIYNALISSADSGFSSPMTAAQTNAVKALCYAVAVGVVNEVQANAAVSVTANPDAFGAGIPAAPVVVAGSIT